VNKIWRRALLLGAVASLTVCGTAQAQVTFGAIPDATPPARCNDTQPDPIPFDIAQETVGPGVTYKAPISGVITSWSTHAAAGPNQRLSLKLVNPFSGGFLVLAHDGPRELVPGQVNTFRTLIPVEEGQTLALNAGAAPTACLFEGIPGDLTLFSGGGDTPDGDIWQPVDGVQESILNVEATILPPPRILAIAPTSGSVAGGTPVTVSGLNFAEVRSVSFSGVPASFSVANEGRITAIAPPNTELTSRTVEVTTVAGRANSPQTFNYVADPKGPVPSCKVPQLKNQKLKAAKKKLKSAGCALGKVKRLGKASIGKGKITRQSPAAGKVLAPGGKVSVTLKGGAKRR
jgi:IPT/TIG domain/PASTA domain